MPEPYHKYVFDTDNRKFIGNFEEMYKNENKGHYDSWYQDDITHLGKQLSLAILDRYIFESVLDIGCGKGAFTNLLAKNNNRVTGIDISQTAIDKARSAYRKPDFYCAEPIEYITGKYNLVVLYEVLSYVNNWEELLALISKHTEYLYISLYIPDNPIGYVKSFSGLVETVEDNYHIVENVLWNGECILLLCRSCSHE